MSVFDLTDVQKDKIAKTQGFVVYEPYKTVVPAYNLNAIQNFILENDEDIKNLKEDILDKSETANENLEKLKTELEKEKLELEKRLYQLESHTKTYKGIKFLQNEWSSALDNNPRIQEIKVEGLVKGDNPFVWLDLAEVSNVDAALIIEDWPLIGRIVAGDNILTAFCYEDVPTSDIPIMIKVIKDTSSEIGGGSET